MGAGYRDNAPAVNALYLVASHRTDHLIDFRLRHEFGIGDGMCNGPHGLVEIYHNTAAQTFGRR
jgi:hypothetical protein